DWPETVRSEIKRANLNNAQIALPVGLIEPALKKGKAVFSWKAIRGWISSAPVPTSSSQDSLMLELPLEFLMPVFMARHGSEKPKRRISVDESIPNLFAGVAPETEAPKAAAGSATKTESLQTNRLAKKAEPQKPAAPTTPNEIVTRAAALDKVAGALIALSDGLLVASRLPSDAKGDTLAAFVPQMFAKMNACIETLSLGELQDLNFTAGNVPWRIYRLDRVFFAVFGRAGQTLPGDELAALAVQLRKGSS
ncbi:MAG TPA: roadblock/LC7 domain-containing protein, partial [Candidatus Paceibacterota bacterium]|nr:roadblock/LC7 domain-containing protein [Candidatus Paceibacterota bacterium]